MLSEPAAAHRHLAHCLQVNALLNTLVVTDVEMKLLETFETVLVRPEMIVLVLVVNLLGEFGVSELIQGLSCSQ